MRRLLFPSFLAALAIAACDPELNVKTVPGTADGGGSEGGATPPPPPSDDGGTTDDGGDASTADDGGDAGTTHVIDGVNDFAPGEKLATTSSGNGYYAYAAWDAKNVYFGMEGGDVASSTANANSKWVLVYLGLDGVAGTTTGLPYNGTTQQPTLPFAACYHIRWKVDGSYTNVQKWSGSAWVDAGVVGVPVPTVVRSGTFMEMGFSQASIGSPSKLRVHMNMLIEGNNADWTYAGVPSTSFTDGKNPTPFTKYFEFDPSNTTAAPNTYSPKP